MSDELAVLVASGMGPGEVDDLLSEAMRVLRERHGDARLHSVSITFSWCKRASQPTERELRWSLQVDNEHGYGDSRAKALEQLRERLESEARLPFYVDRVMDVLREADPNGRERDHILQHAHVALENERRNGR